MYDAHEEVKMFKPLSWQQVCAIIYAREVRHPGFRGTRFMQRALRDAL